MVRNRLAKDIEQVVSLQDAHYLTIKQVGSVLGILKVCLYLNCQDSSVRMAQKIRVEREELFLTNLWCHLNPFNGIGVEARYLVSFLNLVYNPFLELTDDSRK